MGMNKPLPTPSISELRAEYRAIMRRCISKGLAESTQENTPATFNWLVLGLLGEEADGEPVEYTPAMYCSCARSVERIHYGADAQVLRYRRPQTWHMP